MKKLISIISVLLCMILLCTSCGQKIVTSEIVTVEEYADGTSSKKATDTSSKNNKSSKTDKSASSVNNNSQDGQNTASGNNNEYNSNTNTNTNTDTDTDTDNDNDTIINTNDINYHDYYVEQKNGNNRVIVYNATEGMKDCADYSVQVRASSTNNWITVPVYYAEVTRKNLGYNAKTFFASVDLSGEMEVKITPSNSFSNYKVEPLADKISAKKSGEAITFKVNKACQLVVEIDGDIFGCLQLFVNPIETNIPEKSDENVIFVTPGMHKKGDDSYIVSGRDGKGAYGGFPCVVLKSNQTLYLAGGAVLNAQVVVADGAKNVKICGRGIINLLDWNTQSGKDTDVKALTGGEYPCGVRANKNTNLTVEGVIIRNSCSYGVMGNGLNGLNIDNIKVFSRGTYSDGIDCVATKNVKIKNCYIRSNDDGIAIYGTRWGYKGSSTGWEISNMVFNMDCAHAINMGTHASQSATNRDTIGNITVKDIDILDVYENSSAYWGAIAFNASDEVLIDNVTFDGIRMYGLSRSMPFYISVKVSSGYSSFPGYRVQNIKFKNVTLYGEDYYSDYKNKSRIFGYSSDRIVTDVSFENLVICGIKVNNSNKSAYFSIESNTKNITFK